MRLAALPRVPLAHLPTPLEEAPNLSDLLGRRILVKRDDLTGLALGGNKTRKLEYLLADARQQGATTLITTGAHQSNHCRQTAAAARVGKMKCILVMDAPSAHPPVQGNLLLDELLGAEVRLVPVGTDRDVAMEEAAEDARTRGEQPYVIPTGGSNPVGAAAYAGAVFELLAQLEDMDIAPGRLYVATGSAGTHGGLAIGAQIAGADMTVRGVSVSGAAEPQRQKVVQLGNATAEFLGSAARLTMDDAFVDDTQVGPGYAIPTPACVEAITMAAQTEGLLLDPVYTGKAFAGMVDDIRSGRIGADETVVFLHTGGAPALFAQSERLMEMIQPA